MHKGAVVVGCVFLTLGMFLVAIEKVQTGTEPIYMDTPFGRIKIGERAKVINTIPIGFLALLIGLITTISGALVGSNRLREAKDVPYCVDSQANSRALL